MKQSTTRGPRLQVCSAQAIPVVACLLVVVTAVLLCFGALVTTYDAAMAVPDWPSTFGHNMFFYPFVEWFWGPWDLFLEHGHRLLGAIVGMLTLVLVALVWLGTAKPNGASLRAENTILRWLAVAALVLVVVQGLLGGARVLLDDKTVAKVHACTGPLYFAVATAIATLTGRRESVSTATSLPRSWAISGLVTAAYVQLVAGAQLRHLDAAVEPATFHWLVALHVIGAAAVLLLSVLAAGCSWSSGSLGARRWSLAIVLLVACQIGLGCGAWIVNWGFPSGWLPGAWVPTEAIVARSATGAAVVTGHVVLGMMILGAAVVLAILSGGLQWESDAQRRCPERRLERALA